MNETHELSDIELDNVTGGRSHHSHHSADTAGGEASASAKDILIFSAEAAVFGTMASSTSTTVKSTGESSTEVARGG